MVENELCVPVCVGVGVCRGSAVRRQCLTIVTTFPRICHLSSLKNEEDVSCAYVCAVCGAMHGCGEGGEGIQTEP